jgi:Fibronectin-III type domain
MNFLPLAIAPNGFQLQRNQSAHPASLPPTPVQNSRPGMKKIPPRPAIKINNVQNGIIVSWTVEALSPEHAEINSYQIYAYEVTNQPPSTDFWRHVGDVKALLLPMAVTLTQFQEGENNSSPSLSQFDDFSSFPQAKSISSLSARWTSTRD